MPIALEFLSFRGEIWLRPSVEEDFAAVTTKLDPLKGPAPVPEEAEKRLFSGGAIFALTWRSQSSPPVYRILGLPACSKHPPLLYHFRQPITGDAFFEDGRNGLPCSGRERDTVRVWETGRVCPEIVNKSLSQNQAFLNKELSHQNQTSPEQKLAKGSGHNGEHLGLSEESLVSCTNVSILRASVRVKLYITM